MNTLIMQERTNYQPRQISSKAILLALSILSVHTGEVAAQNQLFYPIR
ncbi:MAG: hypothetical protein IPG69_14125 [Flavobacteriales bacterium]|nr:hypothetical protein [Flavobacteriales bacterium]